MFAEKYHIGSCFSITQTNEQNECCESAIHFEHSHVHNNEIIASENENKIVSNSQLSAKRPLPFIENGLIDNFPGKIWQPPKLQ